MWKMIIINLNLAIPYTLKKSKLTLKKKIMIELSQLPKTLKLYLILPMLFKKLKPRYPMTTLLSNKKIFLPDYL